MCALGGAEHDRVPSVLGYWLGVGVWLRAVPVQAGLHRLGGISRRPYEVLPGHHGGRIKASVTGSESLRIPRLNRGTAFDQRQPPKSPLERQ